MGIVKKALRAKPEEVDNMVKKPVKEEIKAVAKKEQKEEVKQEITTMDLIPDGVEMFVRLKDYKEVVAQLTRLEKIINRLGELERMQNELRTLHDKFLEQLENTLAEVEEIKAKMHESFGVRRA